MAADFGDARNATTLGDVVRFDGHADEVLREALTDGLGDRNATFGGQLLHLFAVVFGERAARVDNGDIDAVRTQFIGNVLAHRDATVAETNARRRIPPLRSG
jgi:hypothetical protein